MIQKILIAILEFLKGLFSAQNKPLQPVPDYIPDNIPTPPQKPLPEPSTPPKSPSSLPIPTTNDNTEPYKVVPSSPRYEDYPPLEKAKLGIIARRVCAIAGLTPEMTTELLGTISAESGWNPNCVNSRNLNGTKDWGLCQYNDGKNKEGVPFWIGPGAVFRDVDEVMTNIENDIMVMAKNFMSGHADWWMGYKYWKLHLAQIP